MAYVHKKFDTTSVTEEYSHKKFGQRMEKRKRAVSDQEDAVAITVINDLSVVEPTTTVQQPKRRQTKPLFRPWLNESMKTPATTVATVNVNHIAGAQRTSIQCQRSNKARASPPKPISTNEQTLRDRSTIASLINRHTRRPEQAAVEHQLAQFWAHNTHLMTEQYRATLYLRHLMYLTNAQQPQYAHQIPAQPQPLQQRVPMRPVYQFGRV